MARSCGPGRDSGVRRGLSASPRHPCTAAELLLPGESTPVASSSFLGRPVCAVAALLVTVTYPSKTIGTPGLVGGAASLSQTMLQQRPEYRSDSDAAIQHWYAGVLLIRRWLRLGVGGHVERCIDRAWVSI